MPIRSSEARKAFLKQTRFAFTHVRFKDCAYYPCHTIPEDQDGLNCFYCYCPFYPCGHSSRGGKWIKGVDQSEIWDCSECNFVHQDKVALRMKELSYENLSWSKINVLLQKEFFDEKTLIENKLIVGLVGKVGSGKSTVSSILSKEYGFESIDVDQVGHKALELEREHLIESFGSNIQAADGNIDRNKLGKIVFSDPQKLSQLNSLVHARIKTLVFQKISETSGVKKFVIDAALLFEIGLDEYCDFVVSVETPEELIRKRIQKYRNWSPEKIEHVLNSQRYLNLLKDKTHFIIYNNDGLQKIKKQIEVFILAIS